MSYFKYYGSNAKGKGVKEEKMKKEEKKRKGRKQQNMDFQPFFLA